MSYDIWYSAGMKAEETKQWRESLGLTKSAFARMLGVTYQTVRRWEAGEVQPSPIAQHLLAEIRAGLDKQRGEKR